MDCLKNPSLYAVQSFHKHLAFEFAFLNILAFKIAHVFYALSS